MQGFSLKAAASRTIVSLAKPAGALETTRWLSFNSLAPIFFLIGLLMDTFFTQTVARSRNVGAFVRDDGFPNIAVAANF